MVAKMNGRVAAKKTKIYDSGETLSSTGAPYKRCVYKKIQSFRDKSATQTSKVHVQYTHKPVAST